MLASSKFVRFVLATLVVTIVYFGIFGRVAFQGKTFNLDFVAFYCGGEVAQQNADPYRTEPLRSCEHRVGSSFRKGSVLVLPSPLPAYDVAFFRVASLVPFQVAQWLWFALGVSACLGCVFLCAELTGTPISAAAAALVLSLGYVSLSLGQVFPLSLFGLLLAAYAFQRGKVWLVVPAVVLAAFEPHLALPGLLGLLILSNWKLRVPILVGGGVLGILAFVGLPLSLTSEYVRQVLPLHALSEINNQEQFGVAHLLHFLGISEQISVHASEVLYVVMMVFGIFVAKRAAVVLGSSAVVLVPMTFCLSVSPFLHVTQICAAVPLALLLSMSSERRVALLGSVTVVLFAVPWLSFAPLVVVAPVVFVCVGYLSYRIDSRFVSVGSFVSFVGVVLCGLAAYVLGTQPRRLLTGASASPTSFSETSWRRAVDLSDVGHEWFFLFAKMPAEIGLVLLFVAVYLVCCRRPPSPSYEVETGMVPVA